MELAVAGVGGNESHPCVSAHILLQVCVKLNLPHLTCSGLYFIRTSGRCSRYSQPVEELAENVNCLSVPCVLTTR